MTGDTGTTVSTGRAKCTRRGREETGGGESITTEISFVSFSPRDLDLDLIRGDCDDDLFPRASI